MQKLQYQKILMLVFILLLEEGRSLIAQRAHYDRAVLFLWCWSFSNASGAPGQSVIFFARLWTTGCKTRSGLPNFKEFLGVECEVNLQKTFKIKLS